MKTAIKIAVLLQLGLAAMPACDAQQPEATRLPSVPRPPAVPLVVHTPNFSLWSMGDRLAGDATRHWTRTPQPMVSFVRVDGHTFRLMDNEPADLPALPQTSVAVLPTRTVYDFENAAVRVRLTFLTPALPDDLDVLARPVTYLTWEVSYPDGQPHQSSVYFSSSALSSVNGSEQVVGWSREKAGPLALLKMGTVEQPVLQKAGDNLRIDYGYSYTAVPGDGAQTVIGPNKECQAEFIRTGGLAGPDAPSRPTAAKDAPVGACALDFGRTAQPAARHVLLGYDETAEIDLFGETLRPYWNRNGMGMPALLQAAERDYPALQNRCRAFDEEVTADAVKAGGERYAALCALCYRQCFGGCGLAADANGQPLLFTKENTSNGCIATTDVIVFALPQWLLFCPMLAKASLVPLLNYAGSSRWRYNFAPHDLGTYPRATGQVYGGGENGANDGDKMPVEECGDLLLMLTAVARADGNAEFAARWWPLVVRWEQYLEWNGFDPVNQLSTEDVAGNLAHPANLSVKSIAALAGYGLLCEMRGDPAEAARARGISRNWVRKWIVDAKDGDHYKLAFDQPGTWSAKYNFAWDRVLGLDVFPPEVARTELAYYKQRMDRFGLPMDNRNHWGAQVLNVWPGMLAETPADFAAMVSPAYDFANQTPDRVPLSDWYDTNTGHNQAFSARPTVGGVFIKMLADPGLWKKWAGRGERSGRTPASAWAGMPAVQALVEDARTSENVWRYTLDAPGGRWFAPDYDDHDWRTGRAGFGQQEMRGAALHTEWTSGDIYLRRDFELAAGGSFADAQLQMYHDEDAEVYLNGVLAVKAGGYNEGYECFEVSPEAKASLRPGRNTLAVHCHQTWGGQYIDAGLVVVRP